MVLFTLLWLLAQQPEEGPPEPVHTGGPLATTQAPLEMTSLDLHVTLDPATKTILGEATLSLDISDPTITAIDLELSPVLWVNQVKTADGDHLQFRRRGPFFRVELGEPAGSQRTITVLYHGQPWVAKRAPWDGGFVWSTTDDDQPWIGVAVQGLGGKMWFPCITHPSKKIGRLDLRISVPEGLTAIGNGLFQGESTEKPGLRTFHWRHEHPISTYNVNLYAGPYKLYDGELAHEGRNLPLTWAFLNDYQKDDQRDGDPRNYDRKKRDLMDQTKEYLIFFEEFFGPFPFETFKVIHSSYLGMEHQTANAYGNHFRIDPHYDYDFLLFHEMGHEWWGNKVSVSDWADFWIQEGICTYTSLIFMEERRTRNALDHLITSWRRQIVNEKPIVPGTALTSDAVKGNDVYYKGALMLHALRSLIGKQNVYDLLRDIAMDPRRTYTNKIGTDDFIQAAEAKAGRSLDWFFDIYLKRAEPPKLSVVDNGDRLELTWDQPSFIMPLEVAVHDGSTTRVHRLRFQNGLASLPIPNDATWTIDPDQRVYHILTKDEGANP